MSLSVLKRRTQPHRQYIRSVPLCKRTTGGMARENYCHNLDQNEGWVYRRSVKLCSLVGIPTGIICNERIVGLTSRLKATHLKLSESDKLWLVVTQLCSLAWVKAQYESRHRMWSRISTTTCSFQLAESRNRAFPKCPAVKGYWR